MTLGIIQNFNDAFENGIHVTHIQYNVRKKRKIKPTPIM